MPYAKIGSSNHCLDAYIIYFHMMCVCMLKISNGKLDSNFIAIEINSDLIFSFEKTHSFFLIKMKSKTSKKNLSQKPHHISICTTFSIKLLTNTFIFPFVL